MAGRGARFVEAGYQLPKMLLKAHGKTLLQWSLDSLPLHLAKVVVFAGLREHNENFHLESLIRDFYPHLNTKFIFLNAISRGQAETAWLSLKFCNHDEPLVIFNIDTFFSSTTLADKLLGSDADGILGSFRSTENRFSFAALDESEYVTDVQEKEVISNHALTGLYTFKNVHDFVETYQHHIAGDLTSKGEFYIAPMYNYLIRKGKKYILDEAEKHHILGTPAEYADFMIQKNVE
jgi:dTDP-glucose pyrophosphorylase